MVHNNERIWIWMQDCELYKAMYRPIDRALLVFNSQDELILTYIGITAEQLEQLETFFAQIGAKHLDNQTEPFTYL